MSNGFAEIAAGGRFEHTRVAWVDAVKLFACFLVVLGHLTMSMVSSGLLNESSSWYQFFIQTIYSFHVPLFFVCSGFLYQFHKHGSTPKSHVRSIKKKALALGVPYVVFSSLTLLLKNIFSSEVNNAATPFVRTLLIEPIAPYWYLYTLFLLFCLIPRQSNARNIIRLFIVSLLIKCIYVSCHFCWVLPDLVQKVAACSVWFSFGMLVSIDGLRASILNKRAGIIGFLVAIVIAFLNYQEENPDRVLQFILAILFVYAILDLAVHAKGLNTHASLLAHLGIYFMAVYVLHTICAACIRSILLRIGIVSLPINLFIGLIVSILVPIAVYRVSLSHWWMLFFFEPLKALKLKRTNNEHTS